jgi:hypothetical protein
MKRSLLALLVLATASVLPGCSSVTDFGIKAGPGFDINPFNLGSGEAVIAPANDQWFSNGDPVDARLHH